MNPFGLTVNEVAKLAAAPQTYKLGGLVHGFAYCYASDSWDTECKHPLRLGKNIA